MPSLQDGVSCRSKKDTAEKKTASEKKKILKEKKQFYFSKKFTFFIVIFIDNIIN